MRVISSFASVISCALLCVALTGSAGALESFTANPQLPPITLGGEGYVNAGDQLQIINGLPPGTTINIDAENRDFFNIVRNPDGGGGEIQSFNSVLLMHLNGTGGLSGFNRILSIQLANQTHNLADTNPGTGVVAYPTEWLAMQGQLAPGDPDFDLLRITAGNSFGMPSPGHTTFTDVGGGNWNVDSFFDITYRIDFIGAPGGPLGGMSGSTTATIRMQIGQTIPEPSSMLALSGIAMLGLMRRRA